MTKERRRPTRPPRPTPPVTPDAAGTASAPAGPASSDAPAVPAPRTSTRRQAERRPAPTPGRIEPRRLDGLRHNLVRAGRTLDETVITIWFHLMAWLVTVQVALSAAGRALAREGRAYFEQAARARRGVPIHVFLTGRHERHALTRDLRAALRGLARTNGPLPPALRLSVVAHHSPDGPAAVAGRCVRLRPDADGASTVLIELALFRDGQRLTSTEVVSRLVSCYVALTAAPPPVPDGGQGAAPSPAATPSGPAAPPPVPADAPRQLASTPADTAAPAAPPADEPPAATDDPAGILHLVGGRAGRESPAAGPPSPTRDPRGRWSKHGD